ncbi:MAG: YgiT-type zinc finger protein [Ignavibacteriae bacterium]|nr:YgiT-type zinc finger protein [Ignavibacteriota bacterium]
MKRCYFCKGFLSNERIRHVHQWGEKIVLFENLDVEKCTQCGEVFLSPETLEMIDRKTDEVLLKGSDFKSMTIPVVAVG